MLDDNGIAYEGFIGALYPFMDIAALVTAVVLARLSLARRASTGSTSGGLVTPLRAAQSRPFLYPVWPHRAHRPRPDRLRNRPWGA